MATMRDKWTDERLDDLNRRVDSGFDRVDARFDRLERKFDGDLGSLRGQFDGDLGSLRGQLDGDLGSLRGQLDGDLGSLRAEMNARFERVDARFDSMQRVMLQGVIALSGSILAGFGGIIALIATQL